MRNVIWEGQGRDGKTTYRVFHVNDHAGEGSDREAARVVLERETDNSRRAFHVFHRDHQPDEYGLVLALCNAMKEAAEGPGK